MGIVKKPYMVGAAAVARPRHTWHEDDGPVLWWFFPIREAPYCGTPLDYGFPRYYTHWTPIVVPDEP
jgi:hypothetical protein